MKQMLFLSVIGAFLLLLVSSCSNPSPKPGPITTGPHTIAQTTYGQIQGYCDDGIFTFKGVPYAKAERFMAPEYPDTHDGILKCQVYGAKAMQDQNVEWHTPSDYDFGFQFKIEAMSEDCQVLNIWTPALDKKNVLSFSGSMAVAIPMALPSSCLHKMAGHWQRRGTSLLLPSTTVSTFSAILTLVLWVAVIPILSTLACRILSRHWNGRADASYEWSRESIVC